MSKLFSKLILVFCSVLIFLSFLTCAYAEIVLRVPHLLEYGEDIGVISGAMTCGPCSLEMCVAYVQHREADFDNVKKINAYLEPDKANDEYYLTHGRSTGWDELIRAAENVYGIKNLSAIDFSLDRIKKEIWNKSPVILTLANYGAISNREDKGYTGGHIMVVSGYDEEYATCQDPDSREQNIRYSWKEVIDSIGGFKMIVGFGLQTEEEQETPLFELKNYFLQGGIFVLPSGSFIYKTWVLEQVGNHLMIVEEKILAPLFGGRRRRVVDLENCFLRSRENTPIGKNCLALEMSECIDVLVDQPAIKLEQSLIYINPDKVKFLYEALPVNSRNFLRVGLRSEPKKESLPKEITDEILAQAKKKWFTP